jgi:hypothetical protein
MKTFLLIVLCIVVVLIVECMVNAKDWFEEIINEENDKVD